MEIERINENTVKFYISYVDIEDRGFEREEIWYNRERSEQLFWQMMDEVNYKEDFSVEGPLWIQVQALEKGLEIIVTKAQLTKGGTHIEPLDGDQAGINLSLSSEKIEVISSNKDNTSKSDDTEELFDEGLWMTAYFNDLEDVIQLSYYFQKQFEIEVETVLYYYDNKYYLYIEIPHTMYNSEDRKSVV